MDGEKKTIPNDGGLPQCPICHRPLSPCLAKGRKSGKPFLMLRCLSDGRHFRGFIAERDYVRQVIEKIEASHQTDQKEIK